MLDDVILEESREHQLQDDYRSASINGKHGYPGDVSGQGRSKAELLEKAVVRPETRESLRAKPRASTPSMITQDMS